MPIEPLSSAPATQPLQDGQLRLLLVDADGNNRAFEWPSPIEVSNVSLVVTPVAADEALKFLEKGETAAIAIFAQELQENMLGLLRAFRASVGTISSLQAVICEDPSPRFMAEVFEFGIEQFLPESNWIGEVVTFARATIQALQEEQSSERNALELMRLIRSGDQARLEELKARLSEEAHYDFLAAYSLGRAHEATGQFSEAIEAFKSSSTMNKIFRPASTALGENLLVTGQLDEAEALFKKMDATNPNDPDRKLMMAAILTEKGEFDAARTLMAQAASLSPGNPRLDEARAHLQLKTGNINEAFNLLDKLSEVGPFFAAKLNEMGIRLSQAGKGKSALALYQKAHKVVRADLRYKISMNAALACHRMGSFDLALRYLKRCETEYGSKLDKLEKIKNAISAAMKKTKAA